MTRALLVAAGLLGLSAVALGAFGAHGLESALVEAEDLEKRLGWWRTASLYHLVHAVAVLALAALAERSRRLTGAAAGAFGLGVMLFSGTLYSMSLGAPRWLGAVTPLGGLSLMVGWIVLAVIGVRLSRRSDEAR